MNSESKQEFLEVLDQRAGFYRMLSSIYFKEVTEEFIESLNAVVDIEFEEGGLLEEGAEQVKRYLARKGPDGRTDLAVDYARVFLAAGTYKGERANPYESIYTSDNGLIMQEARDEVRAVYLSQELNADEGLHLPEDHLSFELEFMGIMSDRARMIIHEGNEGALSENLTVQRDFAQDHLLNWLPLLQKRVDECAEFAFYPAMMKMTLGYVQEDLKLLDEMIDNL